MIAGPAIMFGGLLGVVVVTVTLVILVFRKRLEAMDQQLQKLQKTSEEGSWYAQLRQDRSLLELLRSLLELNDLLSRPGERSGGSAEKART
jgi:hypothetical protein